MLARAFLAVAMATALAGCSGSDSGSSQNISQSPGDRGNAVNNRPPPSLIFRTLDGSQNNLANPLWGATFTHLQRVGAVDYADDISAPAGPLRASAREISNIVVDQQGASVLNTFGTSDFIWQWGQFLDHDLDLTDGVLDGGPTGRDHDIEVPAGDPHFDPMSTGTQVITFNRARFDPATGDGLDNPREQENEITAWIDASNVYGSSDDRLAALRVGAGSPLMLLDSEGLMPRNANNLPNANGPHPFPQSLFLAGDVRANEQVALAVMHTLFVREHNRLAAIIQADLPFLTPDQVFFVARRLVGAEMQIITYNEFLPALLGPAAIPPYPGYTSVNASILNEFSVAAYRFGHSALSPVIRRLDAGGNTIAAGDLPLRDAFFSSIAHLQQRNDLDPILRGLASQPHQRIDAMIVDDVRNFLFGPPGSGGLDLASLNIQRGRDHGVGSYNATRVALGLAPALDFDDISSDPAVQADLQAAYGTVDDIDLWVGGLAEDPLASEGSQVGELIRTILVRQFTALRDGDRFWWERDLNAYEKSLVEGITLANVIRANTGVGRELQTNVFFVP